MDIVIPDGIECRSPRAGETITVNPDPAARGERTLARDDDDVLYLVAEEMVEEVTNLAPKRRVWRAMIFVAVNAQGELFLWPVPMPVPEEHIAYRAMESWVEYPTLH